MNNSVKIVLLSLFVTLAMAMLVYGLLQHSTMVLLPEDADEPSLSKSEPSLIKDVTIGGVVRDESGNIQQTYTNLEEAAATCPT